MMDIGISKMFFKRSLQVAAGLKNLFDVKSIQTSGLSSTGNIHGGGGSTLGGYGRSVYLRVVYSFQKF